MNDLIPGGAPENGLPTGYLHSCLRHGLGKRPVGGWPIENSVLRSGPCLKAVANDGAPTCWGALRRSASLSALNWAKWKTEQQRTRTASRLHFAPPALGGRSEACAIRRQNHSSFIGGLRDDSFQGYSRRVSKNRLEAFSDGVLAIIITIMVLELKAPHGVEVEALKPLLPVLLSYVLSFLYVAIYWNNHHHLLHTVKRVSGGILWANMNLLFWLSLLPVATAWVDENHVAPLPTALYGGVLLMAAVAYFILQRAIIAKHGRDSLLAGAIGGDWKGKISPVLYFLAIPSSFVHPWIANAIYVLVALLWLVPDRRIERTLEKQEE